MGNQVAAEQSRPIGRLVLNRPHDNQVAIGIEIDECADALETASELLTHLGRNVGRDEAGVGIVKQLQ